MSRRGITLSLVALLAGTALVVTFVLLARRQAAPAARPNVIVLVIDTLRWDHVGAYGNGSVRTPNLDRLAREGIVFERAYANAPWTKTSVASYFTGLFPHKHGVFTEYEGFAKLPPRIPTIAEVMRDSGYQTLFVSANPFVSQDFGLTRGFDRGGQVYNDAASWVPNSTVQVTRAAVQLLDGAQQRPEPFFLYVHYLDPHDPLQPLQDCTDYLDGLDVTNEDIRQGRSMRVSGEREVRGTSVLPVAADLSVDEMAYLKGLYTCEINGVDEALGTIRAWLEQNGRWQDTVVIVTSDHGEEFMQHGFLRHGYQLYDEVVRVPLIVRMPAEMQRQARHPDPVQLVDLFPSLALLAGVDLDPGLIDGRPLPFFPGAPAAGGERWVHGATRWRGMDRAFLLRGDTKLIVDLRENEWSWFDLAADPGEREPLALSARSREVEARFRELLRERVLFDQARRERPDEAATELSPEQIERLRSLGY